MQESKGEVLLLGFSGTEFPFIKNFNFFELRNFSHTLCKLPAHVNVVEQSLHLCNVRQYVSFGVTVVNLQHCGLFKRTVDL